MSARLRLAIFLVLSTLATIFLTGVGGSPSSTAPRVLQIDSSEAACRQTATGDRGAYRWVGEPGEARGEYTLNWFRFYYVDCGNRQKITGMQVGQKPAYKGAKLNCTRHVHDRTQFNLGHLFGQNPGARSYRCKPGGYSYYVNLRDVTMRSGKGDRCAGMGIKFIVNNMWDNVVATSKQLCVPS